jgi:hypothetical protein
MQKQNWGENQNKKGSYLRNVLMKYFDNHILGFLNRFNLMTPFQLLTIHSIDMKYHCQ